MHFSTKHKNFSFFPNSDYFFNVYFFFYKTKLYAFKNMRLNFHRRTVGENLF